jgi:hypothetical protein
MINIFLSYVAINNNNTKSINDSIHNYHDNNDKAIEKREDSYYITEPFFGLKYRHGKKLELKIRYKNNISMIDRMNDVGDRRTAIPGGVGSCSNGIEIWTKYKLGKKNAHHYKNDIISKLLDCGYDSHDLKLIDPHALFNQTMKIDKSRNRFLIGDMLFEVCYLFINDNNSANIHEHNDNDLQGDLKIICKNDDDNINCSINRSVNTNNKSNTDVVDVDNIPSRRRLQWLSISIEHFNHLNDIKHLLQSNHPDAKHLSDIIISYDKLLINHPINILISRYLLPIASGYPMFINYLSKNVMMDEAIKNDQINVWKSVVNMAINDF